MTYVVLLLVALVGVALIPSHHQRTWGQELAIQGNPHFVSVSCTSSHFCALAGYSTTAGELVDGKYHSQLISGAESPAGFNPNNVLNPSLQGIGVNYISCPASQQCLATSSDGELVLDYEGKWIAKRAVGVSSTEGLEGVSCTVDFFCVLGTDSGNAFFFDRHHWIPVGSPLQPQTGGINAVACPTNFVCYVATALLDDPTGEESSGRIFTYTSSGWESSSPTISDAITTISCPSENFCMAGTNGDNYLYFADGAWTDPMPITQSQSRISSGEWIASVSCTDSFHCTALATDGNIYQWNGLIWTSAGEVSTQVQAFVGSDSISCYFKFSCVVVGNGIWIHHQN